MFRVEMIDAEGTTLFSVEVEATPIRSRLGKEFFESLFKVLREKGYHFISDAMQRQVPDILFGTCILVTDLVYFNHAKFYYKQ